MADDLDTHYVLGDVIGCGGMGIVYSATQVALGRRVAIKIPRAELATNPFVLQRFQTEARAGGRLSHRNITRVIDFGGGDGTPFLVMEYVAGDALETLVAEHGAMEPALAIDIVTQILAALHEAHTAGIVHADIKSGNVLVETLPDGVHLARVIDFGLALFIDEELVNDHRILSGTPEYLAPEVVRGGRPTIASDIYAAGIVLYELLTGATPFAGGTSQEILARHLDDVVVPPSLRAPEQHVPRAIETAVMRALSKEPGARFASAAEFATMLRTSIPVEERRSARLARGTLDSVHSPATPTRNWRGPVTSPAPLAVGTRLETVAIRCVLADAIASGDGDAIVAAYLELVHMLVDDHQLAAAANELEHGLELLMRGIHANATATWRLQLCLAGLYSGLGDPLRARMAARLGYELARGTSSELGQQRAKELLARLSRYAGPKSPPAN
jgi:serine/threonine protein kinase